MGYKDVPMYINTPVCNELYLNFCYYHYSACIHSNQVECVRLEAGTEIQHRGKGFLVKLPFERRVLSLPQAHSNST